MAAKLEEIVVDAHRSQPQHLGKQRAQDLLLRRARGALGHMRSNGRRWQRAPVKLAVGRERKLLKQHKGCRHHVVGKALAHMRAQGGAIRQSRIRRCHHIGDEPLVAGAILARDHRRLGNPGMAQQYRLDLAGLDAKAAQLHLRVGTAEEVQHPVRAPACDVPAAVHAAARRPERVGHEALRREPRTREIAARQPRAGDVEFPRYPRRHRLQPSVQHINPRVPDRPPNGNARLDRASLMTAINAGPDAAFSRTVFVCE